MFLPVCDHVTIDNFPVYGLSRVKRRCSRVLGLLWSVRGALRVGRPAVSSVSPMKNSWSPLATLKSLPQRTTQTRKQWPVGSGELTYSTPVHTLAAGMSCLQPKSHAKEAATCRQLHDNYSSACTDAGALGVWAAPAAHCRPANAMLACSAAPCTTASQHQICRANE